MRKAILVATSFGCGYATCKIYPYAQSFFGAEAKAPKEHSFSNFIKSKGFSQPKIVEYFHRSPDKHFLNNMIAQNGDALNVFKIYYPDQLEQKLFLGENTEDPTKLHLHLVFNASEHLQGHEKVVHGGLLATLIDNAFGQLSTVATGLSPTATANLNINYRKPVKIHQDYMITCEVEKVEGRKVHVKAKIYDQDHNVCTEATGLFVTVGWGTSSMWKRNLDKLKQYKRDKNDQSDQAQK